MAAGTHIDEEIVRDVVRLGALPIRLPLHCLPAFAGFWASLHDRVPVAFLVAAPAVPWRSSVGCLDAGRPPATLPSGT